MNDTILNSILIALVLYASGTAFGALVWGYYLGIALTKDAQKVRVALALAGVWTVSVPALALLVCVDLGRSVRAGA